MANLTITAANVLAGAGSTTTTGSSGATATAGQPVYFDAATKSYKLADCNSATAAVRSAVAITLNGASPGQPLMVLTGGDITIGATLVPGTTYYLSATPGAICPVGDLTTGDYPLILGIAKSATVLAVDIVESGVAL